MGFRVSSGSSIMFKYLQCTASTDTYSRQWYIGKSENLNTFSLRNKTGWRPVYEMTFRNCQLEKSPTLQQNVSIWISFSAMGHRYCMIMHDIILVMNYILYTLIYCFCICDISLYDENASVNIGGCPQRWSRINICSWVEHRLEWLCAEMGWSFERVVVWKIWAAFGYPQSLWL